MLHEATLLQFYITNIDRGAWRLRMQANIDLEWSISDVMSDNEPLHHPAVRRGILHVGVLLIISTGKHDASTSLSNTRPDLY